ncbi:MAG TPA: BON domain-containing protein [Vicinamibacteria bacterium]|jgi:osmotically-inducible protein OsmY
MQLVVLIALLFSAAASALADAPDVDEAIRLRIEERLRKANLTEQAQVAVSVEGGRAVLSGTTAQLYTAREAERLAGKEAASVESRIRVEPEPRSDAQIAQEVRDAVLGYIHYTVFDGVEARVQDGLVWLGGSVRQTYRRDDIEARVAKIAGVRDIHNDIRVQSLSSHDEDLRQQLYRAIYGGALAGRGSVLNAPVHILVDGGRVTLTGVVASQVERALILTLARQTMAFDVDNHLQVEGEEGPAGSGFQG